MPGTGLTNPPIVEEGDKGTVAAAEDVYEFDGRCNERELDDELLDDERLVVDSS